MRALCICAVILGMGLSLANAQYFGPYDKFNRLYTMENAIPVKHLHPSVFLSYWYYYADEGFDEDGNRNDMAGGVEFTQSWFVPAFAFGAGNVVEFGMAFPVLAEHGSLGSIEADGSGIGDITIWLKTAIIPKPWFGFRVLTKLATGDDDITNRMPTGTGQTDFDFGLQFAYEPEKQGVMCDINAGYRLTMSKDEAGGIEFNPGDEGRAGIYVGGMPVEGLGIMFGGDGIVTFNDQYDGDTAKNSSRASAMIGLKLMYRTKFGLRTQASLKTDIAGKLVPAGYGFAFCVGYQPEFW